MSTKHVETISYIKLAFFYFVGTVLHSSIIIFYTPAVSSAHGLSGIRHYETLSYNPNYLQQQHNDMHDKRSLSTSIRLEINAYNRYTMTLHVLP